MTGLTSWSSLDTWIALTAAFAAMSCAVPGTYLLLRGQSLLGDALSHAVLPGLVVGSLAVGLFEAWGWLPSPWDGLQEPILWLGAAGSAVLCGVLSDGLQRRFRVESGAALGIVYLTLFALGLVLLRLFANETHLDPGCVLYGNLETTVTDVVGQTSIPRAAMVSAVLFTINGLLVWLLQKELLATTFDPAWSAATGLPVVGLQRGLTIMTAITVVTAFESVGSILVIAMLVTPAATAVLLFRRLSMVLIGAVVLAAAAAVGGHALALVLPAGLVAAGLSSTGSTLGTAGMVAVVSGLGFFLACLLGPRDGWARQWLDLARLRWRIAAEDVLAELFRLEEQQRPPRPGATQTAVPDVHRTDGMSPWGQQQLYWSMQRQGWLVRQPHGWALTPDGRERARQVVRSHRLWETYLAQQFGVSSERVHASAEKVEHYLGSQLRSELQQQVGTVIDPHGAVIPPEAVMPQEREPVMTPDTAVTRP
jgi:manganese/zinc/iron transport system permease protein